MNLVLQFSLGRIHSVGSERKWYVKLGVFAQIIARSTRERRGGTKVEFSEQVFKSILEPKDSPSFSVIMFHDVLSQIVCYG